MYDQLGMNIMILSRKYKKIMVGASNEVLIDAVREYPYLNAALNLMPIQSRRFKYNHMTKAKV